MGKLAGLGHLFVVVYLSSFAYCIVVPAITDVTMSALCPGKDECSLAIFLTGFQQVIIGLGTVVMMPIIGNLSDQYGRKALFTLPLTVSIIPLVILAYSRTTNFFYAYYVLKTLTGMVCEGSTNFLALAYVADNISERQRALAFSLLSGVSSAAIVCGTLAARFLSTALIFQVAALASMLAAAYMRIFLKDKACDESEASTESMLKREPETLHSNGESSGKIQAFKSIPSVGDLIFLLRSRPAFSQAAVVAFFTQLAEGGIQASLLYFLKAQFHFNKNQFAVFLLILGVSGTISQLLLMPMLVPASGEEKLLSIGLLVGCSNMFLYSIAWSAWVPYVVCLFTVFVVLIPPCLRSIVSKQVGPNEQGKAQGCISSISSFANVISPLIFSPLTALFLSEGAPFHYPGFSLMCIGLVMMMAFIQSIMIKAAPPIASHEITNNSIMEA